MSTMICNTSLDGLRESVHHDALLSFEFFANSLLGASLPEELCDVAQRSIEADESFFVTTTSSKSFARALKSWLSTRGVLVADSTPPQSNDILDWFDLAPLDVVRSSAEIVLHPNHLVEVRLS